jgi:hypothetical protein
MAHTMTGTLRERKMREEAREQELLRALNSRKKVLEQVRREKQQKKKSVGQLLEKVRLSGIEGYALRAADTYAPRSHNLERQLTGLLRHMFARYPVPGFLYQCCLPTDDPFAEMHAVYRMWLIALAQGGSFPKLVKGVMTGREAFLFLSAPAGNRIHENVWWARMKAAGIPDPVIERLMERIFSHYFIDDPGGRLAEVIQFFARSHAELDRVTLGEVLDFLAWKLRNDRGFSLKGRTAGSVVKLTNEWHALIQKAKLGQNVEWKGLGFPEWTVEAKDSLWVASELRSNRELMNEGRKQRHCVYSYVQMCVAGRSAIFSLRSYPKVVADYDAEGAVVWDRSGSLERSRVTVEVNNRREVVQVRGPMNRPPTDEERRFLRHWAGEKGLTGV